MRGYAIIFVVLFTACSTLPPVTPSPSMAQMQLASYGDSISVSQFEQHLRENSGFFDSETARIRCAEPQKGWGRVGKNIVYGYLYICDINAKNRYGGYVGQSDHVYIYSNGRVSELERGWINWGFEKQVNATPQKNVVESNNDIVIGSSNRLGLVLSVLNKLQKAELQVDGGLLVVDVKNTASRDEIQRGDLILGIGNIEILTVEQLDEVLRDVPQGRNIALLVRRNNSNAYVSIKLDGK